MLDPNFLVPGLRARAGRPAATARPQRDNRPRRRGRERGGGGGGGDPRGGGGRPPPRPSRRNIAYSAEALRQPIIGVSHSWTDTSPCNINQRDLAERVKQGVRAAGGTPMEFSTIAVADGMVMGTAGMRALLISREGLADSDET